MSDQSIDWSEVWHFSILIRNVSSKDKSILLFIETLYSLAHESWVWDLTKTFYMATWQRFLSTHFSSHIGSQPKIWLFKKLITLCHRKEIVSHRQVSIELILIFPKPAKKALSFIDHIIVISYRRSSHSPSLQSSSSSANWLAGSHVFCELISLLRHTGFLTIISFAVLASDIHVRND